MVSIANPIDFNIVKVVAQSGAEYTGEVRQVPRRENAEGAKIVVVFSDNMFESRKTIELDYEYAWRWSNANYYVDYEIPLGRAEYVQATKVRNSEGLQRKI